MTEEPKLFITKGKKKLVIRKKLEIMPAEEKEEKKEINKLDEYISQLTAQEKIVFNIAKEHLETSFDLEKSIGYKQWLKTNN